MNKTQSRQDAIDELNNTQHIEILDNELDEKEYRTIIEKFKQTKQDFLQETEERGYSEFMSGVLLGIIMMQEEKLEKRRLGRRNWIPSIFKKNKR